MRKLILCNWNRGLPPVPPARPSKAGGFSFFAWSILAKNDDKMALFSMGVQHCHLAPVAPGIAKLAAPFNIARFLAGNLAFFIHETAKTFIAISSSFLGLILNFLLYP